MMVLDVEVWCQDAQLRPQLAATPNPQFLQRRLVGVALEPVGPLGRQALEVVLQPATVGHRQCRAVGLVLEVVVEPLLHPHGRPYWRDLEA